VQVASKVLKATAAYSDMIAALDVSDQLRHNMTLQHIRRQDCVARNSETRATTSFNGQAAEMTPKVWFDSMLLFIFMGLMY
jgi:hypothetical protein